MRQLKCAVQQYDWGKLGSQSLVGQLVSTSENAPFAELWMGTHVTAPSLDRSTGQLLSDSIGMQLPFLFKVLSVGKALSIQAHPDKSLAERLHRDYPQIYKDNNHKPEMACCITDFDAMCGFRAISEIQSNLSRYPGSILIVIFLPISSYLSSRFQSCAL